MWFFQVKKIGDFEKFLAVLLKSYNFCIVGYYSRGVCDEIEKSCDFAPKNEFLPH